LSQLRVVPEIVQLLQKLCLLLVQIQFTHNKVYSDER
jgi:hypothetical protein